MENLNDKSFEEKREFVSRFNLIDDTFCSVVLENKEASEYLLSVLLDKQIEVVENKTQYSLRSITEHSVILDVLARDESGHIFNIEVNSYDDDSHARRLRYYGAMIDCASLGKNQPYKNLPDLYMIYISRNDPIFGDDFEHKNHYEIGHYIKGTDADYDNGLYVHYFNTSVKGESGSKLAALLKYIETSDPKNNSFGALSERVNYFKYEIKGVDSMCKIVEDYADKKNLGKQIKIVKNLLKKNFTLEEALETAELDRETYEKYLSEQ